MSAGALSGYFAIFTWLPTYLKNQLHLSIIGSGGYLFAIICGSWLGYVLSGYLNDIFGRKVTFAFYAITSALIIYLYTHIQISNTGMLLLGFPLGFFASGMFTGFGPYYAELFPTEFRGAAEGFSYNVGRGISALAPAIVGYMSQYVGLTPAITIFGAISYAVCLFSLLFLPETKGKKLQSLADDSVTRKGGGKTKLEDQADLVQ